MNRYAGVAGILLAWTALSSSGLISENKLPPPWAVVEALVYLTYRPSDVSWPLPEAAATSCARIGTAATLAALVGIPLGALMGTSRRVGEALSPVLDPLRSAPVVALLPLLVMGLGVGEVMKIAFLWVGGVVFLITGTRDAVAAVPAGYADKMRDLGATEWEVVRWSTLPLAAPGIMGAVITCVSVQWTYITVAELVNASSGIGKLIADSKRFSAMDQVVAEVGVILALALATTSIMEAAKRRLFPWEAK